MEELNKNQLILLALLVSFVTSIAASIGTASLLEQAPPKVTQTIHRVVERTVEKVVPDGKDNSSVITQEKTIIVKEEDAITDAIANTSLSLVRLRVAEDDARQLERRSEGAANISRGIAVAIDNSGGIAIASSLVANENYKTYEATLFDNSVVSAVVQERNPSNGVTQMLLAVPEGVSFPSPVVPADPSSIKLGQTLLGLGGDSSQKVSVGIVSDFTNDETGTLSGITASFSSDVEGMPVINLFGEVVGLSLAPGSNSFISANIIFSGGNQE